METEKNTNVMEAIEKLAQGIATNLSDERRQALHEKMLSDEIQTFIKKVHYINTMFSGLTESARMGAVIDNAFHEVLLTTKEFDSNAEANDYAQVRTEEVQSKSK